MARNRYTQRTAPYWRVRPTTQFYSTLFLNGTYSADIMGCNWKCENCWSKYGFHGAGPDEIPPSKGGGVFTPDQIVTKLIAGMERNGQTCCRITGGEASLYWKPHLVEVIDEFLTRTTEKRLEVDVSTRPGGEPMLMMIETHGATIAIRDLKALEERYGIEASRLVLSIGVKATNAKLLRKLTGMALGTCERFHAHQMEVVEWLMLKAEYLGAYANYLDPYTDFDELAALQRRLERERPGTARLIGSGPIFGHYGDPNTRYTPKRFRTNDESGD